MIFGHYTIPLKTISRNELPPELPVERGASFQCGLRVFHILFIPIFPFEKLWVMKMDGNSYKVNPEMSKFFDDFYGRPRTPIYGFAGILLAILAFGYFKYQDATKHRRSAAASVAREVKANEQFLARIKDPTVDDYYSLSADGKVFYAAKVDEVLPDSVVLRYVESDPGANNNRGVLASAFVKNQASFNTATMAKADIGKNLYNKGKGGNVEGMVVPGLAYEVPLKVYKMERKAPGEFSVYLKDQDVLKSELEEVVKKFVTQMSMDSSLAMLDNDSKKYLLDVARLAKVGNTRKMAEFIQGEKFSSSAYNFMLYAHYSYCETTKDKFPVRDNELLKEFGFYTKLLDVGFWTINDHVKSPGFRSVELKSAKEAKVSMNLYSNILENKQNIVCGVTLNKEGGQWKVNLPSTFSYTEYQISKVGRFDGDKTYRKMVRDQLKTLNPDMEIASVFNY